MKVRCQENIKRQTRCRSLTSWPVCPLARGACILGTMMLALQKTKRSCSNVRRARLCPTLKGCREVGAAGICDKNLPYVNELYFKIKAE